MMVQGTQPEAFIQRLVSIAYSFPLLAIPFFIFTGVAINHGGMGRRIMHLADVLAGHMVGGLAQVNVLLATFMAGTSGSSTAEAAMLSRVLIPEMTRKGYDKACLHGRHRACSALIATMIPPSIGLILYGVLANASIGRLFVAGVVPGVLMCLDAHAGREARLRAAQLLAIAIEDGNAPELLGAFRTRSGRFSSRSGSSQGSASASLRRPRPAPPPRSMRPSSACSSTAS